MSQPQPSANSPASSAPQPFSETGQAAPAPASGNAFASGFGEALTQRVSPKAKAQPPRTPRLNLKKSAPPAPAPNPQVEPQPQPLIKRVPTVQAKSMEAGEIQAQAITSSPVSPKPKVQAIAPPTFEEIPQSSQPPSPSQHQSPRPPSRKPSQESTPLGSPLSQFIKRFSPLIWAIVILLVLIPLLGRLIIAKSLVPNAPGPHQELVATLPPDLDRLDQEIITAIQTAHKNSRDYAAAELDAWIAEIDPRVDNFLDWYFDYFNQKKLELSAPLTWLTATAGNVLTFSDRSPSDAVNAKLTKAFQKEFTKRVLVPQTAQLRLEVITTESADRFVKELQAQMSSVKAKYRIPQGQWDRYLDTIATTVSDTEGHLSNLSLKALAGGTGYLATKPLIVASIGKIGSKISAKFTASATAKVAAKTGSSVAAELGTSLIDPIVGVGILIWDVWDYNHTVAIDRPLLRQNIDGYLQSMERSLLDNPETGVMAAIHQVETSVIKSVRKHRL